MKQITYAEAEEAIEVLSVLIELQDEIAVKMINKYLEEMLNG